MGAPQSKVSETQLAAKELIVERLEALQLKHSEDGEYIYVNGNEKETRKYVSKSPSLSISAVEGWQHELLQDPKNRLVNREVPFVITVS
jgi:bleomycin hydrolase